MDSYKSEGVVLKRINYGEADRIVTIFSKQHGKTALIAKGIRRMTSRKRGSLEIFNQISFYAARGKGMDIITEAEVIESFSILRNDLKKVGAAYEICEVVDKLLAEAVPEYEVYESLISSLKIISQSDEKIVSMAVENFFKNILIILGYWPRTKIFPENFDSRNYLENTIERRLNSGDITRRIA